MGAILAVFFAAAFLSPLLMPRLGRNGFLFLALVPTAGFVYSLLEAPQALGSGRVPQEVYDWLPALQMSLVLRMDAVSWLMTLLVTGIGALVFIYCARYFGSDDFGLEKFAGNLMAFAGMMYGLVLADELLVLFIFWEGTTIFSYLLIGDANSRRQARRSALQALVVTTFGGLSMLVGMIMLQNAYGTGRISVIAQSGFRPGEGEATIIAAIMLILVGALSKSAILPFHFWLPGAMAAPTPVSAYLHAASMVKAGIFLVLRLAPGFHTMPGWTPILVAFGLITMLVGGWNALRQFDLKLVLAYGTVSQLGFLVTMSAFGTRDITQAALALLFSHALFKSTLFLTIGIIDHAVGTRDLRKLSGYAKRDPLLAAVGTIAAASMAGLPPLLGFAAKEAAYSTLLESGSKIEIIALAGIFLGSVLTFAYAWRFVNGAFGNRRDTDDVEAQRSGVLLIFSPVLLAFAVVVLGPGAFLLDPLFSAHTSSLPAAAEAAYHVAIWHGFEPALVLSGLTILAGVALILGSTQFARFQADMPENLDFNILYRRIITGLEATAAFVTTRTQRGSMPYYQAVIYIFAIAALTVALLLNNTWPSTVVIADSWQQVAIAALMVPAALAATLVKRRFPAVMIVSITGYGMVAFFAIQGAPDLALTQMLVESITLVVFVLVLRRLPAEIKGGGGSKFPLPIRALIAASFGLIMMVGVAVSMGARSAAPISEAFGELAYNLGHGKNIVNVMLVDIRAWDTLGEIMVVVVAATGVASLIFVKSREGKLQRFYTDEAAKKRLRRMISPVHDSYGKFGAETSSEFLRDASSRVADRSAWLLAGRTLAPRNRSIVLEVAVRLMFHAILVVSVYLLFAGHNAPGGGFAAGLVAGLALIIRDLAGGRYELAEAAPFDAGKLLGAGIILAVGTALCGLIWGDVVLESAYWAADLPVLGHLSFGTSTIFDFGVYFIVIGLALDILRSLGAEVDRHQEVDEARLEKALAQGDADVSRNQLHAIMGKLDSLSGRNQDRGGGL